MNKKVIDRIIEVSEWSDAEMGDTGRGMIAIARELRVMLDAEPEPAYSQREVLIINSAVAMLSNFHYGVSEALNEARALLDEFDAGREVKP